MSYNHGKWKRVYEVDFTSLSLSTASAGGNFTIDGKTWTVNNFTSATTMSVGGANGLYVKCNTANTIYHNGGSTEPAFSVPLTTLAPEAGLGKGFRVWVSELSSALVANSEQWSMAVDTNLTLDLRYQCSRYFTSGNVRFFVDFIKTTRQSNVGSIDTSTNDVFMMQIPHLGFSSGFEAYSGASSGGNFPAETSLVPRAGAYAGQNSASAWAIPTVVTSAANLHVHLGVASGNTNGNALVKFKRLAIEVER